MSKKISSAFGRIALRTVEPSDLEVFYEHQRDPEAVRMAAFFSRDKAAFDAHWAKILSSPQNINRTVVAEGHVVGYVACFPLEGHLEVAYWLGREFWGQGLATQALQQLLQLVVTRPIFAHVAAHNLGSIRVLQKCGFKVTGKSQDFAPDRGEDTAEHLLRLDPDPTSE